MGRTKKDVDFVVVGSGRFVKNLIGHRQREFDRISGFRYRSVYSKSNPNPKSEIEWEIILEFAGAQEKYKP